MLSIGDADRLNSLVKDLREHLTLVHGVASILDSMTKMAIKLFPQTTPTFKTTEGTAAYTPFFFAYALLDPEGGGLPNYKPPLEALLIELLMLGGNFNLGEGELTLDSLVGLSYADTLRSIGAAAMAKKMILESEVVRTETYRRLKLVAG